METAGRKRWRCPTCSKVFSVPGNTIHPPVCPNCANRAKAVELVPSAQGKSIQDELEQIAATHVAAPVTKRSKSAGLSPLLWACVGGTGVVIAALIGYAILAGKDGQHPVEQEVAKLIKSATTSAPQKQKVAGELFLTTQQGDVKKGPGVNIYLIPSSSKLREAVGSMLIAGEKVEGDALKFAESLDAKYPEKGAEYEAELVKYRERLISAIIAMRVKFKAATIERAVVILQTNSEGKFTTSLEPGHYILLTEQYHLLGRNVQWCDSIVVTDKPIAPNCGDNSVIVGTCDDGKRVCEMQTLRAVSACLAH